MPLMVYIRSNIERKHSTHGLLEEPRFHISFVFFVMHARLDAREQDSLFHLQGSIAPLSLEVGRVVAVTSTATSIATAVVTAT